MIHVAVVEDEVKIAELIRDYLERDGYRAELMHHGEVALNRLLSESFDLVILDLMLPGRDGMSICRELRKVSTVPVIMLTARVEEVDRLLGLELGADDYVIKPFSVRELMARVRAQLRRVREWSPQAARTGGDSGKTQLHLDEARYEVRLGDQALPLTPVEFRLLKSLSARPGQILTRQQLLDGLYLDHRIVSDRTVDSHIKNLRKKLDELSPTLECIHSVYGLGYRFEWG